MNIMDDDQLVLILAGSMISQSKFQVSGWPKC